MYKVIFVVTALKAVSDLATVAKAVAKVRVLLYSSTYVDSMVKT